MRRALSLVLVQMRDIQLWLRAPCRGWVGVMTVNRGVVLLPFACQNNALLSHFVSETGRIMPKRLTNTCAKHQRKCVRRSISVAPAAYCVGRMR